MLNKILSISFLTTEDSIFSIFLIWLTICSLKLNIPKGRETSHS